MAADRFVIRVDFLNLRAEVWVNDIPVAMLLPGQHSPIAIPVNQFLIGGQNTIGVMLHAGPTPSRAGEPWSTDPAASGYTGQGTLSLRIGQYAPDQTALGDDQPPLVTIDWQGAVGTRPSLLTRDVTLKTSFGPWAWQSARQFSSIDAELRAGVLDYALSLWKLLAAKNFGAFIDQSAIKLEEITARAYGVSVEAMKQSMLHSLQVHSEPPYLLQPFGANDVSLRLVGGGRMIECLRPTRQYVLEYRQPGTDVVFFLPTMIGQTASGWRVLR